MGLGEHRGSRIQAGRPAFGEAVMAKGRHVRVEIDRLAKRRSGEGRGVGGGGIGRARIGAAGEGGRAGIGRRRIDRFGRLGLQPAIGLSQAIVDPGAGVFQQACGALFALADPFAQFGRDPVLAVLQAIGDARQLIADVVHGLGGTPLGVADAFGEAFGDAGDLAAQFFQSLGAEIVRLGQAGLHDRGHALHFTADLFDRVGGAGLHAFHLAAQHVGHAQDFVAHALDRLGGPAFGVLNMAVHRFQGPLHAVEAPVGGVADLFGHFRPDGVHAFRQIGGQLAQAEIVFAAVVHTLFGGDQALVQAGERGLQAAQGGGGPALGLFQALGQAGHDGLDQVRCAAAGDAGFHASSQAVDILAQAGQGFAGAVFTVIEVAGDLGQGAFHGLDAFGRPAAGGFQLDLAHAFGHAGLVGAQVIDRALEPGGHRGLLALGHAKAGHKAGHRLIDTVNGLGGPEFGRFDPCREPVQRFADPHHFITHMAGRFETPVAVTPSIDRRASIRTVAIRTIIGGRRIFGKAVVFEDHLIEPFA